MVCTADMSFSQDACCPWARMEAFETPFLIFLSPLVLHMAVKTTVLWATPQQPEGRSSDKGMCVEYASFPYGEQCFPFTLGCVIIALRVARQQYLSGGIVVCRSECCVALQAAPSQVSDIGGAQRGAILSRNVLHAAVPCLHVCTLHASAAQHYALHAVWHGGAHFGTRWQSSGSSVKRDAWERCKCQAAS